MLFLSTGLSDLKLSSIPRLRLLILIFCLLVFLNFCVCGSTIVNLLKNWLSSYELRDLFCTTAEQHWYGDTTWVWWRATASGNNRGRIVM